MEKINKFVTALFEIASENGVKFEMLANPSDMPYLLEKSSDIDFIFFGIEDLNRFVEIIIGKVEKEPDIEIVSINKFASGQHWIFECRGWVFMLDLMCEMRFQNFRLMGSRVFFELKEAGLDAVGIARFIKSKTGFKQAWPGVPPETYSFRVTKTSFLTRTIYFFSKVIESIASMLSAKTGAFVVILGPDGSGKSTVIEQLSASLCGERTVIPVFHFHWRPQLFCTQGEARVVTNPHAQALRGRVMSLLKLVYLCLTFNLGYWLRLHRLLHRGCIVMFDRYYHDLLVDSRRYRLRAPAWLGRLVGRSIPQPDLWILLDAPAEVIHSRKQEVPLDETERQRAAYRELIQQFPNSHVVDASRLPDSVAAEVKKAVLDFMGRRTAARLGTISS